MVLDSTVVPLGFTMYIRWVNPASIAVPSRSLITADTLNVSPMLGIEPSPHPALMSMSMQGTGG